MKDIEKHDSTTEHKILDAARAVFVVKGMDGARMQEIADKAGINKALLHYYFRTKERLFQCVFNSVVGTFIPKMIEVMGSELPLFTKIESLTGFYLDMLEKNPFIYQFVLSEISHNPDRIADVLDNVGGKFVYHNLNVIEKQITEEYEKGLIRKIDPRHLIVNIISMCIFPIVARPILSRLIFRGNIRDYKAFIAERRKTVPQFVIDSIKIRI